MKNKKKNVVANLQKANAVISFSLLLFAAFFAACSTPTVSDDDSSESSKDVSQKYAEAKVMPSGTYNCTKYKCVTTEYLNQEFLEAGKYGEVLDERDGQVYKTVQIGDQTWMAENLDYKTKNSWCGGGSGSIEGDCSKYGRFYTWASAVGKSESECGYDHVCSLPSETVQGVCLSGWHLPSKTEWKTLFDAVDGQSTAGTKLKSTSGWYKSGDGTDAFGFSAFPAGHRSRDGLFNGDGEWAEFWSATEGSKYVAYSMVLRYDDKEANMPSKGRFKEFGYAVRCLKD